MAIMPLKQDKCLSQVELLGKQKEYPIYCLYQKIKYADNFVDFLINMIESL